MTYKAQCSVCGEVVKGEAACRQHGLFAHAEATSMDEVVFVTSLR